MKTISYETIDKTAWPDGPWKDERCDKRQWQDEATGLPCMVRRHPRLGQWCGYVGVPPEHPLHGRDGEELEVHGGVTLTGGCEKGDESTAICHVPEPGEPDDIWWFGFDAGHAWDVSPGYGLDVLMNDPDVRYRDLAYMEDQCRQLAQQLSAVLATQG